MTVDQGAVHTFMAPTEGTVKLSGSGAVKSGAFPNLQRAPERISFPRLLTAAPLTNGWRPNRLGPERLSFPRLVNSRSQRWCTLSCADKVRTRPAITCSSHL